MKKKNTKYYYSTRHPLTLQLSRLPPLVQQGSLKCFKWGQPPTITVKNTEEQPPPLAIVIKEQPPFNFMTRSPLERSGSFRSHAYGEVSYNYGGAASSACIECDPGTAPKTVKRQALLDLDVLLYYYAEIYKLVTCIYNYQQTTSCPLDAAIEKTEKSNYCSSKEQCIPYLSKLV